MTDSQAQVTIRPLGWPSWARPYSKHPRLAAFAQISLSALVAIYVIAIGAALVALVSHGSAAGGLEPDQFNLINRIEFLAVVTFVIALVPTVVVFSMWIYHVYRNLPALGATNLQFSPRAAVIWWFVPIFNLWQPYKIVREIYQGSALSNGNWPLIKFWWAMWLCITYGAIGVTGLSPSGPTGFYLELSVNLIGVLTAACAILLIRRVQSLQETRASKLSIANQ